jgi:RNA polymerase sigma-70 factor (ECF subfamily)
MRSEDGDDQERQPVDASLVERLRGGDSGAFGEIVWAWSPMMLQVARGYVSTEASAQEVVQDAWLAMIRGLDKFEGRSTLRTWMFAILGNLGRSRGVRESRTVPWSSLVPAEDEGPAVDPDRFRGPDDQWPRNWTSVGKPRPWPRSPEDLVIAAEDRSRLEDGLAQLPERQRVVVTLRDVHGLSSDEVCSILDLSAANQRVLLHRGRSQLRALLELHYASGEPAVGI